MQRLLAYSTRLIRFPYKNIMHTQIHPQSSSEQLRDSHNDSHIEDVRPFEEKPLKIKKTILDRRLVSPVDLENYLVATHPTINDERYDCGSCCGFETGMNCCFSADEQSDLNQYGGGVTLYFRFLKQLTIYFAVFALLSIPQILFSVWCTVDIYSQGTTFNQALFMTTLGSMSMQGDSCMKLSWKDVLKNDALTVANANALQKTILSCKSGKISSSQFYIGFIEAQSSTPCSYQDPSSVHLECTQRAEFQVIFDQCLGKQECSFLLKSSLFMTTTECLKYQSDTYAAYAYSFCQDSTLTFISSGVSVPNKTLAVICGYLDLAIVLILVFLIYSLEKSDNETMKYIHQSEIFISSFSLEFSNLPELPANQLYRSMIINLQSNLKKKYPHIPEFNIVDVQYNLGNRNIILNEQKNKLKLKRNNLVKKHEIRFDQFIITSMDLRMNLAAQVLNAAIDKLPPEAQSEAHRSVEAIQALEEEIGSLETITEAPVEQPDRPSTIVWVTFETLEQRNLAFYLYKTDYLRELFSCCTDLSLIQVDGAIVRAQAAPHPDDINWENLSYSNCEILARRSVSLIATLVLIIATIAAIIFLKYEQVSYASSYPQPNCSVYQNVTPQEVVEDSDRTVGKIGLVECYCKKDIINRLNEVFPNGQQLCQKWINDQVAVVGWPFLIVVVIILINNIIQFIFTKFAEFEAHRSKSRQLSSRLVKVFAVQFINTALVILIINVKFKDELSTSSFSVLLNGKFDDITVQWFSQVGTTIILTMMIYVSAPLVELTLLYSIKGIKKALDTCCLDPDQFTRKLTKEDLCEYYTGPEFNVEIKYSIVMNIISVNLIYGASLPALYFSTTFYLLLTYWIDKYILLAYCRLPQKTDDSLAVLVRWILKFILIWHTIFAIWIYGSPKLFPETENFNKSIQSNSLVLSVQASNMAGEFFQRAATSQALGLTVVLFLMITFYVIWPFILSPVLRTIFFFCFSESSLFQTVENSLVSAKQSLYECKQIFENPIVYTAAQIQKLVQIFKQDVLNERNRDKEYNELKKKRIQRLESVQEHKGGINGICSYSIYMNPKYEQFQL